MRKNNNKNNFLPYNPGILPTRPAPKKGEKITFEVKGYPPYKDRNFSIRNPKHPNYKTFVELRKEAINAMAKRAWHFGPVEINFTLFAPEFEKNKSLSDYDGGIADTLDGSSGRDFTYLPIVFEDDCQIVISHSKICKTQD